MKKAISKLFSFGNKKSDSLEQKDTSYTDEIISSIEQKPYAISEKNVMYAGITELTGYFYFKTIIVGKFKGKTFKGITLEMNFKDKSFTLNSDMLEIVSDFGKTTRDFVTPIDFEINKEQLKYIEKHTILSLQLKSKKQVIDFKPIG